MIIGLCGYARSGKDSVANMLVARYGYIKLGFADGVREMALAIDPYVDCGANTHFTVGDTPFARYSELLKARGYEAAKACPDVRRLLQRIGTEAVRDVLGVLTWVDLLMDRAGQSENVVISDVRFPNEAEAIRNVGGIVVRIERPGYGGTDPHPSEAQVAGIETNATISATNMEELTAGVEAFMASLPGFVATLAQIAVESQQGGLLDEPRVYLAAPWFHKAEAITAKRALEDAGLDVVSTWTEWPDASDPAQLQRNATSDWNEMLSANTLVLLNLKKSDGKASEMGGALALGKRVILVGPREGNIFYHLPQVKQVDTLDQAILLLGAMPANVRLIGVLHVGDDVVSVETGDVIATKLGTVTGE